MRWVRTTLLQSRFGDSIFFRGVSAQRRNSGPQAGKPQPEECVSGVRQVASQTPGAWSRKGRGFGLLTAGRREPCPSLIYQGKRTGRSCGCSESRGLSPRCISSEPETWGWLPVESTGFLGSSSPRLLVSGPREKSGLDETQGCLTWHQVTGLIISGVWILPGFLWFSHGWCTVLSVSSSHIVENFNFLPHGWPSPLTLSTDEFV